MEKNIAGHTKHSDDQIVRVFGSVSPVLHLLKEK